MFSIGDGKRKFLFNYKTLESLKLKFNKNTPNKFLTLYNKGSKSYTKLFSYNNHNYKNDENNPSKFIKTKKSEINQIKEKLLNKKVDILLNKVFDKSTSIRHYNSYKDSINICNKKLPKLNYKSHSIDKNNLFTNIIKKKILTDFNHFFPEKYINSREREITKVNTKNNLLQKRKKFADKNKLFIIKYINKDELEENKKEILLKRKEKLTNQFFNIYNGKNGILFKNINKGKIEKKFDVGLRTIPYL